MELYNTMGITFVNREFVFPFSCYLSLFLSFIRQFFQELSVEMVPPYMIASKEAVKEKTKPIWSKKPNLPSVTNSYHTYMCNVSRGSCSC